VRRGFGIGIVVVAVVGIVVTWWLASRPTPTPQTAEFNDIAQTLAEHWPSIHEEDFARSPVPFLVIGEDGTPLFRRGDIPASTLQAAGAGSPSLPVLVSGRWVAQVYFPNIPAGDYAARQHLTAWAVTGAIAAVTLLATAHTWWLRRRVVLPFRRLERFAADVAALTKGVQDGGSLTLAYQVLDVESGEVLAASNADQPLVPASNTKLLTLTSLLSVFDGTETFDTTVVSPAPGQLVLVGGGDPLLASAASDAYPKRASLEELAARTAQKLKSQGVEKVTLGYDASLFQESWATTWPSSYRDQVTPISALWADEGMDASQARSTDPAPEI